MPQPVMTTIEDAQAAAAWETSGLESWIDKLHLVHPHTRVRLQIVSTGIAMEVALAGCTRSTVELEWPVQFEDLLETMDEAVELFDHVIHDFVWFRNWITPELRAARADADPTTAILLFRLVTTTFRGTFYAGSLVVLDADQLLVWPPDQGPRWQTDLGRSWQFCFHFDGRLDIRLDKEAVAQLLGADQPAWLCAHPEPDVITVNTWAASYREAVTVLEPE